MVKEKKLMSQTEKQKTGTLGEQVAVDFLVKNSFVIKDRNYRKPWGEIDIIAANQAGLRFVEVKTVVRTIFKESDYRPEDNIHPWKLARLKRAIQTYLLQKGVGDEVEWQLDVISVYLNREGETLKIDWLEDVF